MSQTAAFWFVIVVLALGTWLMRSLPIMLHGAVATPRWAERLLRYVPVAALTALVVPDLYIKTGPSTRSRRTDGCGGRGAARRASDEERAVDAHHRHGGAVDRTGGRRRRVADGGYTPSGGCVTCSNL